MEDIKPSLMELIDGDDFFQRILVVESVDYIEPLHARFPLAKIFFVTTKEEDAQKFPYVESFLLDYREERLPFPKEFFDAIIGDLTLEVVITPQDIAAGFLTYIKQTGCWLTSFRNIRHWKVLEKLMRGVFGGIVSRLYTNTEFIRLLIASFYKDFRMLPLKKNAPPELLERLITCGFDNLNDDLQVEFWLVKASRSMPELSLLKTMFTPEIRAEFSRILHRIEYDIATEDSVKKFWRLVDAEGIFTDYAAEFIRSVVIHRENFYRNVKKFSARAEFDEIIDKAESLYDFDTGNRLL
ncbi:MAG: hypothetical protein IJT47_05605 [Selenomonadaceae bacterium]|nr:hypothetical protein [Selenomonadaceae bacterium]